MNSPFSRKIAMLIVASTFGTTILTSSTTVFAQESAFARKSAAIKADFQLERAVQKAFDHEKHFDSSDIRVVARKGVISLDGTAQDDKQIQKAAEVASATPGVQSVKNSLTVKEVGH